QPRPGAAALAFLHVGELACDVARAAAAQARHDREPVQVLAVADRARRYALVAELRKLLARFGPFDLQMHAARDAHFRNRVGLDDLNPWRPAHRAEILGGLLDLLVG